MRNFLLLLISAIPYSVAMSQNAIYPGGVRGVACWFSTDEATASFKSRVPGDNNVIIPFKPGEILQLNFQPSLYFTPQSHINIPLKEHDLNSSSLFTVYQALDTAAENHIWHIAQNQKTDLVLTTDRMADLRSYEYMNYKDLVRKNAKVNVYVQHKTDSVRAIGQSWLLGTKPAVPKLPVSSFKGLIPEVIAFNRVLGSQERLQVATYLALKYGITLSESSGIYLNSTSSPIWEGDDYPAFHHNVAGIGRDDASGLYLKKATSSNIPGLLTIATDSAISNLAFLVWGDNDRQMKPDQKSIGIPGMLQKRWQLISSGAVDPYKVQLTFDTRHVDAQLTHQPVYWLAIDRTGKNNFSHPGVEYIRMSHLTREGQAVFNNILLGKERKEVLALIPGQALMLSTQVTQPVCQPQSKGSLHVKTLGGEPPLTLSVRGFHNQVVGQQVISVNTPVKFSDISAGRYLLEVRDREQQVYRDSFYVNYEDVPVSPDLQPLYFLRPGGRLQLDASRGMSSGIQYVWSGPGQSPSFDPRIGIEREGTYLLTTTKNGCSSNFELKVLPESSNIFSEQNIVVYPNPSSGLFTAKVSLKEQAPVTMAIYTANGKLISMKQEKGFSHYRFSHEISTSGVYRIVFSSGQSTYTKTLVIIR